MYRLQYFVRETLISLRRNLMMTVSGIITIAVTATMIAGMLLFIWGNDTAAQKQKGNVQLEVYMNVDATRPQVADVRAELERMRRRGLVKTYEYSSHEQALADFKKFFPKEPELAEGLAPKDLPESFRVNPRRAVDLDAIASRFQAFPGVQKINTPARFYKAYFRKVDQARNFVFGGAVALTVAAAFLVVTTVRLATYARRREIEVMKLVGASNLFVRVPFLAEGVVQGAIGGALAFGLTWFTRDLLEELARSQGGSVSGSYIVLAGFQVSNGQFRNAGLLVLLGAGVIGLVSALVGVRRFLDV